MKTKTLLSILALGLFVSAFSQKPIIELTFAAKNNGQYVTLDSILIENLTQGGDTTLYAPDTVLVLDYVTGVGNNEPIEGNNLLISQNYPNPFRGKTEVNLYLPEKEHIKINVRDILGRVLAQYENTLKQGNHAFSFYSGNEKYYLLTVTGKQQSRSIKMLNANSNTTNGGECKIVYSEYEDNGIGFKSHKAIKPVEKGLEKTGDNKYTDTQYINYDIVDKPVFYGLNNFVFSLGDELKFTAYSDIGETSIIDLPTCNQIYIFLFAGGEPCPGMPTVTDIDGNTYITVQIDSQCWMAENLKTTTYQNGTSIPNVTNGSSWSNLTTGAYVWYNNDISWKDLYGGLYNWYATVDANGLCPTGWHVPTNDEWTALTDIIGGIGSPHGNELKSCRQVNSPYGGGCNTSEHPRWNESSENGTDDYGFSGLPGGARYSDGPFTNIGTHGIWWSSTEFPSYTWAWFRILYHDSGYAGEYFNDKQDGFSVRCLRD